MANLTILEINILFRYATDNEKCLQFTIKKDNNTFVAEAICEYSPDNIRLNKFYFQILKAKRTDNDGFFGPDTRLKYCGESSGPLYNIGGNKYADNLNNIYIV